ncbi:hypothetical protein H072_10627 [Dactylellina haptotyla CBS 200.50]|uniref:Uncharacterized protein n=1 Tax=Dactylellina haptotyla (strain CBS 200.50) TaxID=1284197 RepID=S8A467_DACHA|nr:hypothetical protein H072_10627 [Dactylellina haptotyla CBS 200.50]
MPSIFTLVALFSLIVRLSSASDLGPIVVQPDLGIENQQIRCNNQDNVDGGVGSRFCTHAGTTDVTIPTDAPVRTEFITRTITSWVSGTPPEPVTSISTLLNKRQADPATIIVLVVVFWFLSTQNAGGHHTIASDGSTVTISESLQIVSTGTLTKTLSGGSKTLTSFSTIFTTITQSGSATVSVSTVPVSISGSTVVSSAASTSVATITSTATALHEMMSGTTSSSIPTPVTTMSGTTRPVPEIALMTLAFGICMAFFWFRH